MNFRKLSCIMLLALSFTAHAANTLKEVNQVSSDVTIDADVDYVITNATPFTENGKINITNTEHAVLIIREIRPSYVLEQKLLDGHVFINGEQAVNGVNCQVRMYAHGTIIMPYAKDFKPLTVYSEQDYGGTAVNAFGLEHSGGFMNTLSEAKLNNQIRSFKLKRGYMVTFATGKSGWGYSRCFIADTEDLELPVLPEVFDGRISSYRVFQWHDVQKKGLASDTGFDRNVMLGTTYCYDWATGVNHLPDRECVPHQIYVAWPSASACGSVNFSCHMQTNNEPGNSADDTPQSVEVILNQWQDLMRTGMRLCSESSRDGSWSHLDQFIAEVDKRGWRCDILDLHCYWASGFGNMEYYYNKYGKRPIWITEYVWGASWNNNGIFATDRSFSVANQQKNLNEMRNILTTLNNSPYVERYAYWNGEADCSKLIRGTEMSLTGEYYRDMKSGMAYRKAYEKVPNVVYTAPASINGAWDNQAKGAYKVTWTDTNGDMLDEIQIQRKAESDDTYTTVGIVNPKDMTGKSISYSYVDTITEPGIYDYRVVNITPAKAQRASQSIKAAKASIQGTSAFQYGNLPLLTTDALSMEFTEKFSSTPAIFMGSISNENTKLHLGNLLTKIRTSSFTYQPLAWLTSTSTDYESIEEIPFMAIETGNYKFGNLDCEVGVAKVSMKDTADVVFAQPFPEGVTPVVLTELRNPTLKSHPISIKIRNVTNTGFKCIIMYEDEVGSIATITQNVAYMAITPGVGFLDEDNGTMIAAGVAEELISGTTFKSIYFKVDDDTLRCVDPYIFANLQTNNYDAATMLRTQNRITKSEKGTTYTIGARLRRVTDSSRKYASDGTKLSATSMKDRAGWVALYTYTEGSTLPTAIEAVNDNAAAGALRPYVVGNVIHVDGVDCYEVYSIHGVKCQAQSPLAPGVYIVRAGNAATMTIVR